MALARHGAPDTHHSDQGKQYAAAAYRDLLPATTQISMAAVGQPTENSMAERFIRTLKEEHIDYSDSRDFDDALEQLAHWLEVEYTSERIHSSLGYLTPAEFEAMATTLVSTSLTLSYIRCNTVQESNRSTGFSCQGFGRIITLWAGIDGR